MGKGARASRTPSFGVTALFEFLLGRATRTSFSTGTPGPEGEGLLRVDGERIRVAVLGRATRTRQARMRRTRWWSAWRALREGEDGLVGVWGGSGLAERERERERAGGGERGRGKGWMEGGRGGRAGDGGTGAGGGMGGSAAHHAIESKPWSGRIEKGGGEGGVGSAESLCYFQTSRGRWPCHSPGKAERRTSRMREGAEAGGLRSGRPAGLQALQVSQVRREGAGGRANLIDGKRDRRVS